MRALVLRRDPARWENTELPEPVMPPSSALIDVKAAGLNRADLLMRDGDYVPASADWGVAGDRVGFEMAGVVRAVGARVRGVAPGDRVMAQTGGACAERVAVDHRFLMPVPDGLSWEQAAALPSALLTEFDALIALADLAPGDRVLVSGATSGVGLVAVQLARALGAAEVVATTRSPEKEALLRSLGATHVIDTSRAMPSDPPTVDVILDHVGGRAFASLLPLAAPRARIVQIGRLAGGTATLDLELLAARRLSVLGTTFRGREAAELYDLVSEVRERLPALAGARGLRPHLDSVHDLASAEDAAARLGSGHAIGKVVLTVG